MSRPFPLSVRSQRGAGLGLVSLATLLALTACQPTQAHDPASGPAARPDNAAPQSQFARLPDGRRINLRCSGRGAPTILLEGGFAATSLAWSRVQPELAKRYRVCSYDRAGYGFSDPGPEPRDGAAVARDLDRALRSARVKGPFVVVGHSAGGLYVRLFSNRRPREVVGMVLVDPSVEHQDRRFAALFGPNAASLDGMRTRAARCQAAAERKALPSKDPSLAHCMPEPTNRQSPGAYDARREQSLRASTWRTQVSELDSLWGRTSDQVSSGRQSYKDMRLIVLTAGEGFAEAPEPARSAIRALWYDLHSEIAAKSTRGEARIVPKANHMMTSSRPDAIVAAVIEVASPAERAIDDHRTNPPRGPR